MGKLMASLLQMAAMLASALPLFALCLLLGGASLEQVGRVFAVTIVTALVGGSLGILLASWRDKTFQTVALTVLAVVLYLVTVSGLFGVGGNVGLLGESTPLGISVPVWRAVLNPFESIEAVLAPPDVERTRMLPLGTAEGGFVALMLAFTVLFITVAVTMLRVWNPSGGRPTFSREAAEEIERKMFDEAKEQPKGQTRPIWENPVLWREVRTRAYGRKPIVVKLGYVLVFAAICVAFYFATVNNPHVRRLHIAYAIVPIIVTSLILVNVQAVTAITSERDGRALDLLLVTDISPKEFIFGKIWGVLYNTKEMVLLPLLLCIFLLIAGFVGWEVWTYIVLGIAILVSFSITLGLHASLAYAQTRAAIITSLGTIVFLFIGVLVCIFLIRVSANTGFAAQLLSFVLFICVGAIGMYAVLAVRNQSGALFWVSVLCPILTFYAITHFLKGDPGSARGGDPLGSFLAIGLSYGFAVLAMLVPAVSEFDVATGRTG
jgi:hypothetical protein